MSRKKFSIQRQTHYDTLGLTHQASEGEIKKAYKSMALKCHPDKNSTEQGKDQFLKISQAYSTLSSNDQKKNYDAQVKEQNRKDKAFTDLCDIFFHQQEDVSQNKVINDKSDTESSKSFPENSPLSKRDQEFINNFQSRVKQNETKREQNEFYPKSQERQEEQKFSGNNESELSQRIQGKKQVLKIVRKKIKKQSAS